MKKTDKRLINFRGFLISGVCIIINALLFYYIFYSYKYDLVNFLTYLAIVGVCLLSAFLLFFIVYFWLKFGYSDKVLAFIVSFIACLISFLVIFKTFSAWPEQKNLTGAIEGKIVKNVYRDEYDSHSVIIDNTYLDDKNLRHKVLLYIEADDNNLISDYFEVGKYITVQGELIPYTLDGYSYNTNIAYYAYVEFSDVEISAKSNLTFIEKIQVKLHEVLLQNLGAEIGELSYSMITGDKNSLDRETANSFSLSGLGHLLAVSGLHIGFICAAVSWILKKCKVNKYVNLIVVGILILFYSMLAGFSGSVLRAGIMTMIALIGSSIGKRNDLLNNLFFAVTCILTFRPILILYVGLILSISAVLGIILFSRGISNVLKRIHIPRRLADYLAVCLSVNIAIMPVMIFFFNSLEPYSIISNMIVIPIMSVSFAVIFLTSFITMILPFMAFSLKVSSVGIALVSSVASLISKLPGAGIIMFGGVSLFIAYLLYFLSSRFVIKGKATYPIVFVCIFILCIITIVPNVNNGRRAELLILGDGKSVDSIVFDDDKNAYFIGEFENYYTLKDNMIKAKVRKLDAIYLTSISEKSAYQLKKYFMSYPMVTVYFPLTQNSTGIKILIENGTDCKGFENNIDFGNGIKAIYSDGNFKCYKFYSDNNVIAFFSKYNNDFSNEVIGDANLIRSYSEPPSKDFLYLRDKIYFVNEINLNAYFCYSVQNKLLKFDLKEDEVSEIKKSFW